MSKINKEKLLIVNADDFGLRDSVNQAIIHCYQNGLVRSASLMSTCRGFESAVKLAKANPGLSIGVHLTLIKEAPALPASTIPSLVNSQGKFFCHYKDFIKRFVKRQAKLDEIEKELSAQIERVIDQGLKVGHLNGHMHLHLIPGIFERVIRLAKKYQISFVRFPISSCINLFQFRQLVLQLMIWKGQGRFLRSGLKTTDHFFGIAQSGRLSEEKLIAFLAKLKPGVTEIMTHPTFVDQEYFEYKSYCDEVSFDHYPEQEVAAITSQQVKYFLDKHSIALTNFTGLTKMEGA